MPTSRKLAMLPPTMTLLPVQFAASKKVHSIPVRAWALLMTLLKAAGTVMHPVGMVAKLRLAQFTKLGSGQTLTRTTWAEAVEMPPIFPIVASARVTSLGGAFAAETAAMRAKKLSLEKLNMFRKEVKEDRENVSVNQVARVGPGHDPVPFRELVTEVTGLQKLLDTTH
ncbi:hypothetical protein C8J57DRAFT_1314804, partial [Mycena rebaudengoi]